MSAFPPEFQRQLDRLQEQYVASLPQKAVRLSELVSACDAQCWNLESRSRLRVSVHKLAGSLGMHGLDGAQLLAETLDAALEEEREDTAMLKARLDSLIAALGRHE